MIRSFSKLPEILSLCTLLSWSTLVSENAAAAALSLMQDESGFKCKTLSRDSTIESLTITPKDELITIHWKKKKPETFESMQFLGTAILAKSSGDSNHLLFQIDPNGTIRLFIGSHYSLFEKACEDTGASKKCTVDGLGDLYWSSEELGLTLKNGKSFKNKVSLYGVYPKTGTYFLASGKGTNSLALMDFGAPLQLIVGRELTLSCIYEKMITK